MSDMPPVAPDQAYGVGQDQLEQLAAMPLPDNQTVTPTDMPARGVLRGQAPDPAAAFEQVMGLANGTQFNPLGLNTASMYPDEPLTAGLSIGLGPGPEALPPMPHARNQVARVFEVLAAVSESPQLAALAAQMRGGQ